MVNGGWKYYFGPYILVVVNLFLTINLLTRNAYMENGLYNWHTLSLGDNKIILKFF